MHKTQGKIDGVQINSFNQRLVRLRRILAFVLMASEDRCRLSTLFSNSHLFFENEPEKIREYNAVKRDFEWWWRVKNTIKKFVKDQIANW